MNTEPVTSKIIEKVTEKTGRQTDELQPLQEVIDCDAIEAIVESSTDVYVEFPYEGYIVEVQAGNVSLREKGSDNRY